MVPSSEFHRLLMGLMRDLTELSSHGINDLPSFAEALPTQTRHSWLSIQFYHLTGLK